MVSGMIVFINHIKSNFLNFIILHVKSFDSFGEDITNKAVFALNTSKLSECVACGSMVFWVYMSKLRKMAREEVAWSTGTIIIQLR